MSEMDIAVVDGFTQNTGDWRCADMLKNAGYSVCEYECEQNNDDENSCKPNDIGEAEVCIGYSFGGSTLWDETGGWKKPNGKDKLLVVGVAIVADALKGQLRFSPPASAHRAYSIYATRAMPETHPFANVPTFNILDPDLHGKLARTNVANINCDALFSVNAFDFIGRVRMHQTIQNKPEVLDLVAWMVETLA